MFSVGAFTATSFSTVADTTYGTAYSSAFADGASGIENMITFGTAYRVDVFDGSSVSEQISYRMTYPGVVGETAGASDTTSALAAFTGLISEVAEAATYRQTGYGYSTGGFSSGPFDALGDYLARVSGDVVSTLVNVNSAAAESAVLTDRPFTTAELTFGVQESAAAISDIVVGSLTLPASFEDSAQVTDTASYFIAFPASIDESAQGSDEFSSTPNYAVAFLDGASGQDEVSSLAEFGSIAAEQVVISDFVPTTAVLNNSFADSATVADNPIGNVNFRTVVLDSGTGSDSPSIRLQWELIDTYEASDWVLIDTFTPQS